MSQSSRITNDEAPNILTGFRVLTSIALIVVGVILALYMATIVLALVRADEPPGLVAQLTTVVVQQADVAEAAINEQQVRQRVQPIDIAPDLKKTLAYLLVFLMLLIPASIATKMIAAGAALMPNDSAQALEAVLKKLKQPN
ncbi:MAG: hypothetical protein HKN47_28895 [Pirellulaceae bacterium]|nr:hypothetical protein [Pirellulaceae bacterium]